MDKACESDGKSSSGSEYETDEEWEVERKKQAAVLEKDKGNDFFKKGKYIEAIECYSKGAELDPTNPLLPANRAMALLKQDKYAAAELDCSVALTLDPLYTKAYLRRGTARLGLRKFAEAKSDCERVLQLEPQNKKAKTDLELIEKELAKESMVTHSEPVVTKDEGIVKAVFKAPHERSKKPLRRIHIEEVGLEDDNVRQSAINKVTATQSEAKRHIVEREAEMFQKFTANSPADIARMTTKQATPSVNEGEICDRLKDVNVISEQSEVSNKVNAKPVSNKGGGEKKLPAKKEISPKTSPRQLAIPSSSVQFLSDYKLLKDPESFYQYFKNIKPADYLRLFGEFLDDNVLVKVLSIIKDCYIRDGVEYYETLQGLTNVHRFSMVAMFLSKKDKQVLSDIFKHLKSSGSRTENEISSLAAKFDLR